MKKKKIKAHIDYWKARIAILREWMDTAAGPATKDWLQEGIDHAESQIKILKQEGSC